MEILRGERVVLRPYRDDDASDVAAGCNDALTQRYLSHLPTPYTLDDARQWIGEGVPAAIAAGGWDYAIADPATDRLIGAVGVRRHGGDRAEIGYWVAPTARGTGAATEATRLLAAHVLANGVHRLVLQNHQENVASQRVALAAGFTREAVARDCGLARDGSHYDQIVWSRLATDSGEPAPRVLPNLPGGELTDGVVRLRPVTVADIDDIHALHILPESWQHSVPPEPPTRERTVRRCALAASHWLAGLRADLTIRDAATDTFAGDIGLFHPELGQAMVGYSQTREWRGRGYVTRAVNLLVDWAFTQAGLLRIIAGTAPDNTASHAVLIRAGFEREGYQRARLPGPDGTRVDDIQWVRLAPKLRG
jgi:RimJ/RimL family protein N-acetyltransferase